MNPLPSFGEITRSLSGAWRLFLNRADAMRLFDASLGGFWLVFHTVSGTGSLTAQFLAYMALVIPLIGYLAAVISGARMGIVQSRDRHRLGPGISRGVAS